LRLRIFVRLLEAMFDHNQKFKADLNANSDANSLRVPSFGRDITGYTYWYQVDSDLNFRLYKDEPDEEGSWSLVSKYVCVDGFLVVLFLICLLQNSARIE